MANNKDIEVIIPIDYNELLQQPVAVLPWGQLFQPPIWKSRCNPLYLQRN